MPQLHALQLAGPENKWRCDCRLRKLVRLLLHKPTAKGAPNSTILQDEPRCHHLPGARRGPKETAERQRRRRRRQTNDLDDGTIRRWPNNATSSLNAAPQTTTSLMSVESIRSAGPIVSGLTNDRRQVAKNHFEATERHEAELASGAQMGQRPEAQLGRGSRTGRDLGGALAGAHRDDDHQDRHGTLWTSLGKFDLSAAACGLITLALEFL